MSHTWHIYEILSINYFWLHFAYIWNILHMLDVEGFYCSDVFSRMTAILVALIKLWDMTFLCKHVLAEVIELFCSSEISHSPQRFTKDFMKLVDFIAEHIYFRLILFESAHLASSSVVLLLPWLDGYCTLLLSQLSSKFLGHTLCMLIPKWILGRNVW